MLKLKFARTENRSNYTASKRRKLSEKKGKNEEKRDRKQTSLG
jgi:hypothetical protein